MSIFEYDKEKEEKKLRKAEYEHGLEAGRQEGISIGKEAGRQEGISIGKEAGREEGITIGKEAGRQESLAELITKMYKNGFTVEQISSAIDKSVEEIKEILNRDAI